MGVFVIPLINVTKEGVTILGIDVEGPGIGDVVEVEKAQIEPEGRGLSAFPSGIFTTDPPVNLLLDGCHSPPSPMPLEGFTLAPGQRVRVWMVLKAGSEGKFESTQQLVTYRWQGTEYQQNIAFYFRGRVVAGSGGPPMDKSERACLDQTTPLNPDSGQ